MITVHQIMIEAQQADRKYGPFTSTHEALGVLLEEFEELKDAIHRNAPLDVQEEATQVAAVAFRLAECCTLKAFAKRSGFEEGNEDDRE